MINLFVNYYINSNINHQNEIDYCFQKNLDNKLIDKIYIFVSDIINIPFDSSKIELINIERPTFTDFIKEINSYKNLKESYNIIINSDIYFDDSLALLEKVDFSTKVCLALAREEVQYKNIIKVHTDEVVKQTQDCWVFKGEIIIENIEDVNFNLGIPGCDNRFAYELFKNNYKLLNLCRDIKVYHNHFHRKKYNGEKIPKPYKLIEVTRL